VNLTADVVLPCLDEAEALPRVLARVPPGWRAIVVDNGSTDGSARIAAGLGATVVSEPRRGFGAACHAGLLAATAEFVCFCDCDASLDPALLPDFVRRIAAGGTDLVLGRRRPVTRGAFPPHARAGNLALARMLRRRTGLRLHDLGPLRAARREPLLALGITDRRSGYPLEMVVRAADARWRVSETDVPYHPRAGRSKVTGTWRGTWHAVRDMRAVLRVPAAGTQTAPGAPPTGARPPLPANTEPTPAPARTEADATPAQATSPANAAHADAAPANANPADATPAQATVPANARSADASPVNPTVADAAPVNAAPVNPTVADTTPVDITPVRPTPSAGAR
jgi:dTDP-L-rhamnose 4-epimerase